jgi:S-DNA-T family DNA segregation ATPase FtsK/SpoIIIE
MAMKTSKRGRNERSIVTEAVSVALIAAGVLTALSLATYDPRDPSMNVAGSRAEVSNLVGIAGAWIADALLQAAGLLALAIPAALIALGARGFVAKRIGLPWRLLFGLVVMVLALAGLLSVLPKPDIAWLQNTSAMGGTGGLLIARALTAVFKPVGAAIVLGLGLLVTVMLTLQVSLSAAVDRVRVAGGPREKEPGMAERLRSLASRFAAWRAERSAVRATARAEREVLREQEEMDRDRERREREERRAAEEKVREGLIDPPDRTTARLVKPSKPAEPAAVEEVTTPPELPRTDRLIRPANVEVVQPRDVPAPAAEPYSAAAAAKAKVAEFKALRRNGSGAATAAQPAPERPSVITGAAGRPSAPPPAEIDPDVAEMVSTASIVRMEPARPSGARRPTASLSTETGYRLPSTELLTAPPARSEQDERELEQRALSLAEKCKEFSVTGHIHRINPGPVVTTFEFKPDPGVKYSRIVSLADDLCLALKAESIRIDRIPGKSTVGIEVPNTDRATIFLRDIIESDAFQQSPSKLTLALGHTIDGQEFVSDLQKMPHLLIAGSTGSGKSVMVNAIVTSILYKAAPDEVKFIMVDPKRLELGLYEGVPHLLTPIVVDPKRAANALKWAVAEMENRYRTLAGYGVRNIEQYNREVRAIVNQRLAAESDELPKPLPYIVILIDELADLMMVASSEVEASITRLAQMARAVGIHLVLATQRPSVDVITGLIKANFPSRMSFRVSSKVDSRTIIDANGAEQLLGQGDMLFLPPGTSRLVRVHGSFLSEADVKSVTSFIKQQGEPSYDTTVTMSQAEAEGVEGGGEQDELFEDALKIVCDMGRASTSVLQRRLRIGYGRAAAILDQMEQAGFVGPPDGSRPRTVLQVAYEFRERNDQMLEERKNDTSS